MADLDSTSKRASSVALFGLVAAPVLPDGTIGQGDRQHIAFSYSGIMATGGAPPPSGPFGMPTIPDIPNTPTFRMSDRN